jgi:hypothetical protein
VRIKISYSDQNESFGSALPSSGVIGTVARQLAIEDWGDNWSLVDLEAPFSYGGLEHSHMVVKSRWQGYNLGGREPTSIFILLVPDPKVLEKASVCSSDFEQAAWGMAERVAN